MKDLHLLFNHYVHVKLVSAKSARSFKFIFTCLTDELVLCGQTAAVKTKQIQMWICSAGLFEQTPNLIL